MAAAAVSPSLVSAAPVKTDLQNGLPVDPLASVPPPSIGQANGPQSPTGAPPTPHPAAERTHKFGSDRNGDGDPHKPTNRLESRAFDGQTAGGNAYTGNSDNVYGGNVINESTGSQTYTAVATGGDSK